PAAGLLGGDKFRSRVSDGHGGTATAAVTVTVTAAADRPPAITSAPVTTGAVGQPYTYDVGATDPDTGDTLTFSLPTAPAGMTIKATTGLIQWTPTAAQAGPQNVTGRVRDQGGLFVTQSFTVQVRPATSDHAPVGHK